MGAFKEEISSKDRFLCRSCGQPGHRSFECIESGEHPTTSRGKGSGKGKRGYVCRSCGDRGHRSFECPGTRIAKSALVVVPPPTHWSQILEIKEKHIKKSLKRPAYPHISILTSAPPAHSHAAKEIAQRIQHVAPFSISLNSMTIGTRSPSLFLVPDTQPSNALQSVHQAASEVIPGKTNDISVPHIGMGCFRDYDECEQYRQYYLDSWVPIDFSVRHVFIIELRDGPNEPWTVTAALPLSGVPEIEEPVMAVGSRTVLSEQL